VRNALRRKKGTKKSLLGEERKKEKSGRNRGKDRGRMSSGGRDKHSVYARTDPDRADTWHAGGFG